MHRYTEKQLNEYLDRLLSGEQINMSAEMSDELRSALELAKKMLQVREEPTADFKSQLRAKLLQRLLQMESVAASHRKSEGFTGWLQKVIRERWLWPALTGAAVVALLFVSLSVWQHQTNTMAPASPTATTSAPTPSATGSISVKLPARIAPANLTYLASASLSKASGQATVYAIQTPDVSIASTTELGRKLGFSGDAQIIDSGQKIVMVTGSGSETRQLYVWTASGAIEYGFTDPAREYPESSANLQSERDAKRTGYDFLKNNNLLPPGYSDFSSIENSIIVTADNRYVIDQNIRGRAEYKALGYWVVNLPYRIDNTIATGPGSKIEINIGSKGEVLKLVWAFRGVSPAYTGSIRSPDDAYRALTQGEGSIDIPLDSSQVVVKQVRLSYWIDPLSEKQTYALPVYEFKGECLDKSGRPLESFTGWIEALTPTVR